MRRAILGLLIAVMMAAVVVGALALRDDSGQSDDEMSFALPAGTAKIEKLPSGWRIGLDVELPRLDGGQYYQAWLKNDAGTLVPIGTFNEGEDVVLWAGVSPLEFPTLTVTQEEANGDQASSGDRVLVGRLETGD